MNETRGTKVTEENIILDPTIKAVHEKSSKFNLIFHPIDAQL